MLLNVNIQHYSGRLNTNAPMRGTPGQDDVAVCDRSASRKKYGVSRPTMFDR